MDWTCVKSKVIINLSTAHYFDFITEKRFFSLIETAKLNNLEPYAYLRYLFEQLPLAQSEEDLKRLMPQHLDPALLPSPSVR